MRSALLIAVTLLGWLPAQESESPKEAPAAAEPQQPERRQGPPQARSADRGIGLYRADMMADLAWRNLGPSNPIGRVTDIEVPRQKRNIWYIGTAGGGVWKTENAGTTFAPLFDHASTVSIGDIAVAPGNPDIVWVGTGEENARNSVQWGDGIYKSTDGGGSFQHMGLRETFQIGHIAIHPQNPDIVFVAALGQLWGDNDERGVYRSKDGGQHWERVLFLDQKTGCIDVRIDPQQPDTVYACMFERRRDGFDDNDPAVRMGKSAGLYKSTDGGTNWRQLTKGLPSCEWGRSGISIYQKDPAVVFLIVETERSGWASGHDKNTGGKPKPQPQGGGQGGRRGGPRGGDVGIGFRGDDGSDEAPGAVLTEVREDGAATKAGIAVGDRITKIDTTEIKSFDDLRQFLSGTQPEQTVKVTFVRGDAAPQTVALTVAARAGGGSAPNGPNGSRLNGQVENVQDYQGDDGFETGGVFRSQDHGETWTRVNSLTERPFYYSIIAVDAESEQNVYCVGTTFWGTFDGGKKFEAVNRGIHVDFHAVWVDPDDSNHLLTGCDGGLNETFDQTKTWQVHTGFSAAQFYHVVADNSVPYNVVGGLQDNGTWIGPSRTRNREGITPDDWSTIYGGDGFGAATDPLESWIVYATSQNGAMGMVDMRSGGQVGIDRGRAPGRAEFNWDAPFFLSPHNRLVLYQAGNYAWRGDRYAHLDNRQNRQGYGPVQNQDRIRMEAISPRLGLSEKGTATAFAESPRVRGLLYVGTDDGALWRSSDGGGNWQEIHARIAGVGGPRYISKITPSYFQDNRVYLAMDGHRSNDFHCLAYVSDDRGDSWQYLADDLPLSEPAHAVLEDPRNENLLYLGTEFGCYASLDRGSHWFPLGRGLPTVAVRDLFVQDRDSELVAATHGRGVFVLDVEPLRQFTAAIARGGAHLFAPKDGILWRMTSRGTQGQRGFHAANPPYGVAIDLYLPALPAAAPHVTVHDVTGKQVAELTGKRIAGLQVLQWEARAGRNQLAPPGAYSARFKVGDDVQIRSFTLHADPELQQGDAAESTANPEREKE